MLICKFVHRKVFSRERRRKKNFTSPSKFKCNFLDGVAKAKRNFSLLPNDAERVRKEHQGSLTYLLTFFPFQQKEMRMQFKLHFPLKIFRFSRDFPPIVFSSFSMFFMVLKMMSKVGSFLASHHVSV